MSDFAFIFVDEPGGPKSYITKALNNKPLSFNSLWRIVYFIGESLSVKELSDSVINSQTCWLSSSLDAAMFNVFTSATAFVIDVFLWQNILIGVLDPGHDLFVSTHVWP